MECRPERRAIVACRRLDEHVAEAGLLADFSVGHAVHGAAAGETERGRACRPLNMAENMEDDILEHALQRRRERLVPRLQRLVRSPRRSEQHLELRRVDGANLRLPIIPRHLDAVGPVTEVRQIQLEAPALAQPDQ